MRDEKGGFRCIFAKGIGIIDYNQVELLAKNEATKITISTEEVINKNFVMEGDFEVVITWVSTD